MTIQAILKSQYHASLAMLLEAIDSCPDSLWTSEAYTNPYWQVAYHTVYYTHLYLQPDEFTFTPWEHHRPDHHRFGPRAASAGPLIPYSPAELMDYGRRCEAEVDGAVDRLDLTAASSGFSTYRMPKLEHQLVNLRHVHHHTGQLADRLRQAAGKGIAWVRGMGSP
ncbi:MAG TPA: DinB family protein [Gemmatimonadales bacterium]|nr:DinB family protein [Gemmatimonadales bacterium]